MDYIDLRKLTLDELAGVVHIYPWYGGARKELCRRMLRSGGEAWGERQYAEEALYIGSREKIADLLRSARKTDCSDRDIEQMLRQVREEKKQVRVVGGDYFTQAEYDENKEAAPAFPSLAARSEKEPPSADAARIVVRLEDVFCTETMAAIYAEQGYFDQAKRIYEKLILSNPEKSAYFASLISKLT